ncbi:hypothetical protein MSAN_00507700 [Mycena sanguinolenta]|uniref:Uncharacterized protein n=1 Tax=Mycena sanguinolenta TaxID=230812 RepID=A0A8H6Z8L3_9AGAR|nr:hypothetical protein MSAN_00507700 [Mycena sanguinolenta]
MNDRFRKIRQRFSPAPSVSVSGAENASRRADNGEASMKGNDTAKTSVPSDTGSASRRANNREASMKGGDTVKTAPSSDPESASKCADNQEDLGKGESDSITQSDQKGCSLPQNAEQADAEQADRGGTDLLRFGRMGGGTGGDGGDGGMKFGSNAGSGKGLNVQKDPSPQEAGNDEGIIGGGTGGKGGWGRVWGGEGGVGGGPIIPLEAVGEFKWIEGGRGGEGGSALEIGGKGGDGEAPTFPETDLDFRNQDCGARVCPNSRRRAAGFPHGPHTCISSHAQRP